MRLTLRNPAQQWGTTWQQKKTSFILQGNFPPQTGRYARDAVSHL